MQGLDNFAGDYLTRKHEDRVKALMQRLDGPTPEQQAERLKPEGLRARLAELAPQYQVDPALALAMTEQESGFNIRATSHKGAQGLMQLMPATAKRFGVTDPYDPEQNMHGGLRYVQYLQKMFPNDPVRVLAAYNAGEGAVKHYGGVPPYRETQNYVTRIMGKLQAGDGTLPTGPLSVPTGEPALGTGGDTGQRLRRGGGPPLAPSVPASPPGSQLQTRPRLTPEQQRLTQAGELPTGTLSLSTAPLTPEEATATAQALFDAGQASQRVEVSHQRSGGQVLSGLAGTVEGVLTSPLALGLVDEDTPAGRGLQKLAAPFAQAQQALQVQDPTLADQVFQAIGSQAALLVPSLGIGRALQVSGRLVGGMGLGATAANAVLEAGVEASQLYEQVKGEIGEQAAQERANTVFWKNAALIAVTDAGGMFNETLRPVIRAVSGAVMEGLQERVQYNIQTAELWVPGDSPGAERLLKQGWQRQGDRLVVPWRAKDALTAQAIGTFLGGTTGAVLGAASPGQFPTNEQLQAAAGQVQGALGNEAGALDFGKLFGSRTQVEERLQGTRVVNEAGAPRRVFHGTPAAFDTFDMTRTGTGAGGDLYGPGLYFTEDPTVAGSYAEADPDQEARRDTAAARLTAAETELTQLRQRLEATTAARQQAPPRAHALWEDLRTQDQAAIARTEARIQALQAEGRLQARQGPNVRPTYLQIRTPFDIDAPVSRDTREEMADAIRPFLAEHLPDSEVTAERLDEAETEILDTPGASGHLLYETLEAVIGDKAGVNAFLKQAGYDGITHIGGGFTAGVEHRVWIAFAPEQVIPAPAFEGAPSILSYLKNERGAIGRPPGSGSLLGNERGAFDWGWLFRGQQPVQHEDLPQQPSPPPPSGEVADVTLREGATGLDPSTFRDKHGRWRIPLKDMPAEELELQDFIRKPDTQGRRGIRLEGETDVPGELRALITQKESGVYGLKNDANGLTLDRMAARAAEAGFLASADKEAFLEALDRSIRGYPVFSMHATGRVDFLSSPALLDAYQTLFDVADTFTGRVEEQRRGTRRKEIGYAEGQELLASGTWTADDVRDILPGTVLNDAMTAALVQQLNDMGKAVQAANETFREAGMRLESPEFQDLKKALALYGELSPTRLGIVAEAGRSLAILNDPLSGMNQFMKQLDQVLKDAPDKTVKQVSDALARIKDPATLTKTLAAAARKPSIFQELLYANLLSSPRTHLSMIFDNAMNGVMLIPDRFAAGVVSALRGGEVELSETTAMLGALPHALTRGWQRAADALRTGQGRYAEEGEGPLAKLGIQNEAAITAERFGIDPTSPIGRLFDFWAEYIGVGTGGRLPQRLALTWDEGAKGFAVDLALHAEAARQAAAQGVGKDERARFMADFVADPPAEVVKRAEEDAMVLMLQAEMGEGTFGAWMSKGQELGIPLPGTAMQLPVGRIVVPFVRIGVNMAKQTQMRSPLALLSREWWGDIQAGGARADLAAGKALFGSVLLGGMAGMAASGMLLGRGPEDRELREAGRWDERQYTIRLGDTYIPYRRLGVLGMMLGLVADTAQMAGEETLEWYEKMTIGAFFVLSRNMLSQTFFQSLSKFFDAVSLKAGERMETSAEGVNRFAQGLLSMAVPGTVAAVQRGVDPVLRDLEGMLDQAYSRVPGWSSQLPARRNLIGEKRLTGWGLDQEWVNTLGNVMSPLELKHLTLRPWEQAMEEHQIQLSMPRRQLYPSTAGQGGMGDQRPGDPLKLTDQQYEKRVLFAAANREELGTLGLTYDPRVLQQLTREVERSTREPARGLLDLEGALNHVVASKAYRDQTDGPEGGKAVLLQATVQAYRAAGDQQLLQSDPDLGARYIQAVGARAMRRTLPEERPKVEREIQRELGRQLQVR